MSVPGNKSAVVIILFDRFSKPATTTTKYGTVRESVCVCVCVCACVLDGKGSWVFATSSIGSVCMWLVTVVICLLFHMVTVVICLHMVTVVVCSPQTTFTILKISHHYKKMSHAITDNLVRGVFHGHGSYRDIQRERFQKCASLKKRWGGGGGVPLAVENNCPNKFWAKLDYSNCRRTVVFDPFLLLLCLVFSFFFSLKCWYHSVLAYNNTLFQEEWAYT